MKKEAKMLLGLDWGQKRIGFARGDTETGLATPLGVADGVDEALRLIRAEDPDEVVVGYPRRLSGAGQNQAGFEEFCVLVKQIKPLVLVDERLSSRAADALPGEARTKAPRDAVAAMLILQAYLDGARG